MKRSHKSLLGVVAISMLSCACTTLKPYDRVYVNDVEMQMGAADADFEYYVESIREGSLAGKGKKGGGGCGCN